MKGLVMFPVIVLIMLTLIGAPAFWSTEGYDVTRELTDAQIEEVRDAVNDLQDTYGYDDDEWYYYPVYASNYEDEKATLSDLLDTIWDFGLTDTIQVMHDIMAGQLMDLVGELGNPADEGSYATAEQIGEILDTTEDLSQDITYEKYMDFTREVSDTQFTQVSDTIEALQDTYGGSTWIQWNVLGYSDEVWDQLMLLLDDVFPQESGEGVIQQNIMAAELTDMIYEAGDPAGTGAYITDEAIFNVIKIDPEFSGEFEELETYGIGLGSTTIFVGVIVGLIIFAFVVGINIFGSGLSDTSVHMVVHYTVYFLLWGILSIGSRTFILDTAYIGIPVWVILTLMYTFGVIGNVSGGGGE